MYLLQNLIHVEFRTIEIRVDELDNRLIGLSEVISVGCNRVGHCKYLTELIDLHFSIKYFSDEIVKRLAQMILVFTSYDIDVLDKVREIEAD